MYMFSITYTSVLSPCSDGIVHLHETSYKLKTKVFVLDRIRYQKSNRHTIDLHLANQVSKGATFSPNLHFLGFWSECLDSFFLKNSTIVDKIYEIMSRNQAKLDKTRKLWNLFLRNFGPLVPILYLRNEDWVLGSVSYHFCDIPNNS